VDIRHDANRHVFYYLFKYNSFELKYGKTC